MGDAEAARKLLDSNGATTVCPLCPRSLLRRQVGRACDPGLEEAIQVADRSPITREILPPEVVENFLTIARMELGVFDSTVTDLERRRYFEMA